MKEEGLPKKDTDTKEIFQNNDLKKVQKLSVGEQKGFRKKSKLKKTHILKWGLICNFILQTMCNIFYHVDTNQLRFLTLQPSP